MIVHVLAELPQVRLVKFTIVSTLCVWLVHVVRACRFNLRLNIIICTTWLVVEYN